MSFWRRLNYLLPSFRRREERDMQEELASLVAMAEPGELGNLTRAAEQQREVWGWAWLEQWSRDMQYAVRTMRKSPVFTATAVISLALAIGANTAIFSLIDALLLRWLPVDRPQELLQLRLQVSYSNSPSDTFSYPVIRALAEQKEIFSGVCGFSDASFSVGRPGALKRVPGAWVTGAFYETLGLRPEAGRLLAREDDQPGAAVVAVLSYDYWERQFAGSPAAIGQTLLINGYPVTIAGVSPSGFVGANVGSHADITLPVAATAAVNVDSGSLLGPGTVWLRALARPPKGVSAAQTRARVAAVWPRVSAVAISPGMPPWLRQALAESRLDVSPGGTGWTYLRRVFEKPLLVLMALVALVFLIACANVANLLLARGTARQHEIGIRLAVGAGRGRIIRQLLTESTLLSFLGAALGVGLSWFGSQILVDVLSSGPFQVAFDLTPNWHVLAFTSAAAIAASVLFGVMPALQATSASRSAAVKEDVRMSRSRSTLLSSLVSAQVALSLVLVIGAGLFIRTLQNLRNLDPGFERQGVLTVQINERQGADRPAQLTAFFRQLLERVQGIPGVRSASLSNNTPMSNGAWTEAAAPKGQPVPDRDNAHFISVGPRFFETMRTPLISGREFMDADQADAPMVAIVNEAFARRHFPGQDAVGNYITATVTRPAADLLIVGVVRDTILDGLRSAPPPTVYVSYFQRSRMDPTTLEIRASGNLAEVAAAIRKEIEPRLPKIPVEVRAFDEQVEKTLVQERLMAVLASSFGVLALILASVGLYGVLAYSVTRRTKEIGIRLALGGQRVQMLRMVIKDAGRVLAWGIAIGLPAAWAASRLVSSMLFGIVPTDPPTILWAAALLLSAGLLAGFVPAYRASRISPMEALRDE